jgi:hypothetical protein
MNDAYQISMVDETSEFIEKASKETISIVT